MTSIQEKLNWLLHEQADLMRKLHADAKGQWGVMNGQQMVEHLTYVVKQANGKLKKQLLTPAEHLDKYRDFLFSEKEFRPNTPNAELPASPVPVVHSGIQEAVDELHAETIAFVEHYSGDNSKTEMNPFFGELDYEGWIRLLYKHGIHHAKQFGLL